LEVYVPTGLYSQESSLLAKIFVELVTIFR